MADERPRYYLTTAIAYANHKPGLHTLYEVIGADVIARWHRMQGHDTRFLTGTDEHSVNIAVMPMFHIAGSGWSMVGLYHGCRTVVLRDVDPARILQVIPEFGVTAILVFTSDLTRSGIVVRFQDQVRRMAPLAAQWAQDLAQDGRTKGVVEVEDRGLEG